MVRSSIRWLLVVAPCQTFKALGSASGSVPVVVFMYIELTAAIAGGVSTLYAVIKQSDAVEGFWNGVIAGHLLAGAWIIYTVVVFVVLRASGRELSGVIEDWRRRRSPNWKSP